MGMHHCTYNIQGNIEHAQTEKEGENKIAGNNKEPTTIRTYANRVRACANTLCVHVCVCVGLLIILFRLLD